MSIAGILVLTAVGEGTIYDEPLQHVTTVTAGTFTYLWNLVANNTWRITSTVS